MNMTRSATQNQLFAEFERLGIPHQTVTHPPVFTVEEARQFRGQISGGHTKNLFLQDRKDRLYLAVTIEDFPVDLKALGLLLGANGRLSFASPERLRAQLGVEPGSVTPFSLVNDKAHIVTPALDEAMLEVSPLNFHPLANTATTAVSSLDLLKFIAAQGHVPLRLRFPRRHVEAITPTHE